MLESYESAIALRSNGNQALSCPSCTRFSRQQTIVLVTVCIKFPLVKNVTHLIVVLIGLKILVNVVNRPMGFVTISASAA